MSKASEDFLRREHRKIFGDDVIDYDLDEHQRLKDNVVAAAKVLVEVQNRSPYPDDGSITLPLQLRFEDAVDALIKFEKENNL